ncbi:hypothetical protein HF086_009074 [Spodoptera exigua]|uniref:Uncharacterized protein n=1 Tax=Spodoptera exigua TaxID=7107 RepID=A0A922SBB7_SPOEX|nr:hypothetical protein HF086_009074 [Spodoptera exigua]
MVFDDVDGLQPSPYPTDRVWEVKTELELVRLRVSSAMGAAWLAAKHVNYELPRDDSAFCSVFYTYYPEEILNGNGDAVNGVAVNGAAVNNVAVNVDFVNGKAVNGKLNGNGIANGNGSIHTENWS